MGINLFHAVHAVGTIPSHLDLAWNSDYAVKCAKGNRDRRVKAQKNKATIYQYKTEELQAIAEGNAAVAQYQAAKKRNKTAINRSAASQQVTERLNLAGA